MAPSPLDTEDSSNARIGCSLRMRWAGESCRIPRGSMLIPARGSVGTLSSLHSLFFRSLVLSFVHVRHLSDPPNKAPEPTSTSVTLRAIVSSSELKHWTENPLAARSAPAVAVAHL